MITLGEVHTGLLQTSEALPVAQACRLLDDLWGEGATHRSRPVTVVESAPSLTGVDCRLPSATGARTRAVGTIESRVVVVGGHVLQVTSQVRLTSGRDGRRRPWAHYLARAGTLEVLGRWRPDDVADGFLDGAAGTGSATLSLGAVAARCLADAQQSGALDRRPPLRAARTQLRWVSSTVPDATAGHVSFTVASPTVRCVRLAVRPADTERVAAICADLAHHDWLLSSVESALARARIGYHPTEEAIDSLRPTVEHLLHVWHPAARLPREATAYWDEFDRQSGAASQWSAMVLRLRDLLTLASIDVARRRLATTGGIADVRSGVTSGVG